MGAGGENASVPVPRLVCEKVSNTLVVDFEQGDRNLRNQRIGNDAELGGMGVVQEVKAWGSGEEKAGGHTTSYEKV